MVKCTQFILKISESANPYSSNVLILLKQAAENDKMQYKYVNILGVPKTNYTSHCYSFLG